MTAALALNMDYLNGLTAALDTSYLNRTPNKDSRAAPATSLVGALMHETAGYGSLDYNLNPSVRSSFNYLITRDGKIYWYVNEGKYICWGGGLGPAEKPYYGKSRYTVGNVVYIGYKVNENFVHVEYEGPNDGTPITPQQTASGVALAIYLSRKWGYPLEDQRHQEHYQVAPGYKSDALGYAAPLIVQLARQAVLAPAQPAPYGVLVDPRLVLSWQAAGGLGRDVAGVGWVGGPGYAVKATIAAPDGNGIIQQCERMIIGQDRVGQPRMPLLSEAHAWGLY